MWLLKHCGVYTYILAVAEFSSSSINANRHRRSRPILHLFLMLNYLPLAHNLDSVNLFANDCNTVRVLSSRVLRLIHFRCNRIIPGLELYLVGCQRVTV
jgi:hypothetical protein